MDKKFLINELRNSKKKNNNKINIFFDKKNLNLIGWQTEDIYQNIVITNLFDLKKNQNIDKKIFKIPTIN